MIWPKTAVVMVVVLTVMSSSADYRTHESIEEHYHEEDEKPVVDYRKSFGDFGDVTRRKATEQPFGRTPGFYRPSGFMDFFHDGPFGLHGMADRTYRGVQPTSSGVSADLGQKLQSNDSGFAQNLKFRSYFDASNSASESDIRPREFPPRLRSEAPRPGGSFSPGFAKLKQDVDKEVDYQRKAGSVRSTKAVDGERSSEESRSVELDGFDFSKFDLEESREQGSPEQSSEDYHQRDDNERNDSTEDTSDEHRPVTPYNVINHYHGHPSTGNEPKHQLTTSQNHQDDPHEHSTSLPKRTLGHHERKVPKYFRDEQSLVNPVVSPHSNLYYRPILYSSPENLNGYSRAYYPSGRQNFKAHPLYKPVLPSFGGVPYKSRNLNLHYKPKPLFKPSHRDVGLEYSLSNGPAKRRVYAISALPNYGEQRSSPQTESFTGVPKTFKTPAVSAYKQKKFCKKAHKKINSRDFPRFEQQQMVCYTCSDKVKNSTYELCRYESEPEDRSFYETVAETRSFKTVFPSSSGHARHERSVVKSNEKTRKSSSMLVTRNKREDDDDDSDERDEDDDGDDDESFNYDVDHLSSSSEERDEWNRGFPPMSDDFSFEEDESEEVTSIEKEFPPPKTSVDADGNSCNTVIKKGHICTVCKNSITGSSSEQCSYSSDPDDDKYEYSSQSRYGSRRNPSRDRYKRFNSKGSHQEEEFVPNPLPEKRYHRRVNLKNKNRQVSDLNTRKFKINNEPTNSEDGKTSLTLEGSEIKVDASLLDTPEVIDTNTSFSGLQGRPDSFEKHNKRSWWINQNYIRAEKTDNPKTDYEPTDNIPSSRTDSLTGEGLKHMPKVRQLNESKVTNPVLYNKYLHKAPPIKNGGGIKIKRKQTNKMATPISGYGARIPSRTIIDKDVSEKKFSRTPTTQT